MHRTSLSRKLTYVTEFTDLPMGVQRYKIRASSKEGAKTRGTTRGSRLSEFSSRTSAIYGYYEWYDLFFRYLLYERTVLSRDFIVRTHDPYQPYRFIFIDDVNVSEWIANSSNPGTVRVVSVPVLLDPTVFEAPNVLTTV